MRQRTIVEGFRNGQRIRYILTDPNTRTQVGMYITLKQMANDFATTEARAAVWTTVLHLSYLRREAQRQNQPLPTGCVRRENGVDVQVDLVD
jgi:hypothetical protein